MRILDLMAPEETVGEIWHGLAQGLGAARHYPGAGVTLASVRPSLALLFRALGGAASVELVEAPETAIAHRPSLTRKLAAGGDTETRARFDGERLALPPTIDAFPEAGLNRACYLWLTAMAALGQAPETLPERGPEADLAQIATNTAATRAVLAACPGLREAHRRMLPLVLAQRPAPGPGSERAVEALLQAALNTDPLAKPPAPSRGHLPFAPVPLWLHWTRPGKGDAAPEPEAEPGPAPSAAVTKRKFGQRRDLDQANRRDSFIVHRFEAILSWIEALNVNRSVDDDDDENAAKAADDQDRLTLSRNDRKAATRLRLHLDLSPADADHERLSGTHTYPEWNHRARSYMPDHVRVLDAPAEENAAYHGNPRRIREVRRQFEALRPRRLLQPRQVEGAELDLDALLTAQTDLRATGRGSDRIWQAARQVERDLSVAFLIDTSRSTEAAIGDTSVIEVAREAMAAMAEGIEAAGDRLGIWGFSSLRRDRVFLSRVKDFADPVGPQTRARIGGLRPGHYTRLGAAIRHVSAQLQQETAARRLLIVLTDGKPNDLDHYEGQHGIEDSRMAVREARRAGLALHGVVIDEDGQDWFPRIFGRGGFTLLPDPGRLTRALPDIYRHLTQET